MFMAKRRYQMDYDVDVDDDNRENCQYRKNKNKHELCGDCRQYCFHSFKFPEYDISFTGTLVGKRMVKKRSCLVCFFITDDDERLILTIWSNKDFSVNDINMLELPIGTKLKCIGIANKCDNVSWKYAELC